MNTTRFSSRKAALLLSLFSATTLLAGNPMAFPEYQQTITAIYETETEAQKAEAALLPLPDGKKIAYTSRWDDTNANHLNMSATLHKHGMKGTFMLHGINEKELGLKLIANGDAIGNHTFNHYLMSLITPNQVFYEIAVYQAKLESDLQVPVVTFVFPFGPAAGILEGQKELYSSLFESCGLYVFPFYWQKPNEYFQRPKDHYLTTNLFASNDREPTVELYDERLSAALKKADTSIPRVTHGIHTWMKPSGFQELDKAFAKTAANPTLLFMTDNEYGAYRYSFHHGNLQKQNVSGKSVTFSLTRFSPAFLGSMLPLSAQFTPKPAKLTLNGVELKQNALGYWELPHNAEKSLPAKYEWLQETQNESTAFPGLSFELIPDEALENITVRIKNQGKDSIKNIRLQLLLPPRWRCSNHIFNIPEILPGDKFEKREALGISITNPDYAEGIYYFLARMDFDNGRIYRTVSRQGASAGPGIQVSLRALDSIHKRILTPEKLQQWSNPGKLEDVTLDGKTYSWRGYSSTAFNRHAFNVATQECYNNQDLIRPLAVDIIMPEDGELNLRVFCGTEMYFNGTRIGNTSRPYKLNGKKGRNRLFLPHASRYEGIKVAPPAQFAVPEGL